MFSLFSFLHNCSSCSVSVYVFPAFYYFLSFLAHYHKTYHLYPQQDHKKNRCFRNCSNKSRQQHHKSRHHIFPWMMPQVTLCFPFSDGIKPLQKNSAYGTLQRKTDSCYEHPYSDPSRLNLPAAEKDHVCCHIAGKNKQAVRTTKRLLLSRQNPNRLFQRTITGQ